MKHYESTSQWCFWGIIKHFLVVFLPFSALLSGDVFWLAVSDPGGTGKEWPQIYVILLFAVMAALMSFGFWFLARVLIRRKLSDGHIRQLYSAVEQGPFSMIITDVNGSIDFVNRKFSELTGLTQDEVVGKGIDFLSSKKILPEMFNEKYKQLWDAITDGNGWRGEFQKRKNDSEFCHESVSITPIRDSKGAVTNFFIIKEDITAYKQVEAELQDARDAAEDASRAKSEFLANMSHEIRTPMNGIIGMTDLVLATDLTVKQREYLNMIESSAESLLAIINDILDFSKIEAGKLDIDEIDFDLENLVEKCVGLFAVLAHDKGLKLTVSIAPGSIPAALNGDPYRLRQILTNLIGNAVKFTDSGDITVHVEAKPGRYNSKGNLLLHFSVKDTGIGIIPGKMDKLFQLFSQVDNSAARKYGGTGLGLAISKKLAEMMGGRMDVESKEGVGSTFGFTIPFKVQKEKISKTKESLVDIHNISVLVVDYNKTSRMILHDMLNNWGASVVSVSDVREGIHTLNDAYINQAPVNLILLDSDPADIDGFAAAEQIKKDDIGKDIPIIMLSSSGSRGDAKRCLESGISGYLSKPVKQSELFDIVMNILGKDKESARLVTRHLIQERRRSVKDKMSTGTAEDAPPQEIMLLSILLAEDNLINQKLATALLKKKGWRVVAVSNGKEALDVLASDSFDLVLMDVQMPEMDGFETTAAIRKKEAETGGHISIIAMTAHAMKGDRDKCIAAGMDDYIAKPINAEDLYAAIRKQTMEISDAVKFRACAPVDVSAVMNIVEGDTELLTELLGDFMEDYPPKLTLLKKSIKSSDFEKVERTAHSLKGAVGNFGAKKAYNLAYTLEKMGKESQLDDALVILQKLDKELERFKTFFSRSKWKEELSMLNAA